MGRTIGEIMDNLPEDRRNEIIQHAEEISHIIEKEKNINKLISMNAKLQYVVSNAPIETFDEGIDPVEWKDSREYYFENVYNYVFSSNFSKWVIATFPNFKDYWCDPDTTYAEDVCAFSRDLDQYVKSNFQENIQDYLKRLLE